MRHDEFLARVRERGEYRDQEEAAHITRAVLEVLGHRITPGEAADLAAQLPGDLGDVLTADADADADADGDRPTDRFGIEEFYRRVGERTGARPRTAQWDASAVLSTLADAVSGGELNQIISQLPSGFAVLFGKADLAD
ncbi:DUF2267 domain-containing protein [Streptomyces thermolilacinus]|uniref:DUF2267 domain-containing protein n=1 Tax=Streptomyces thermolilacinus SPC6 TaxID=1306406 RepID=A0A1D3DN34_9ACTN|nr:DUF2267 domain-containing protein [Streptomyces thermolilacinus]OEJ93735.1 hypothetical protein J116_003885 [Streptomyces thermolilacinus SPC6]